MTVNEERVKEKLKEALCNLYNTEISFANEVAVKALIGLTLDKQSILMLEISETLGKNVPACLHEDGHIIVSHKPLAHKDCTTKRPALENANESCKRQKINIPGSEPPSILSALTKVEPYHNNKSIQDGIAHKHQVNSGFTTIPTLAESSPQGNKNQEIHIGLENPLEVKNEPVSDDEGDVRMEDEEPQEQVADGVKVEDTGDSPSPVSSPGPFSVAAFTGEANINQLTGMNMFANMYDAKNPVYSPFQGVHHRYQMDGESSNLSKRLYNCDQCSYSTTYPSNLKRHKQKHLEPDSRPMAIHLCDKCDYKTGWASNLKRHVRTVHGENPERVYECPSCMTIQVSKEEPVLCKSCKKIFNSSQMMKQHVQNIMQLQMNATDPDVVDNAVRRITKTVLGVSAKEAGSGKELYAPPVDLIAGIQRNRVENQQLMDNSVGNTVCTEHSEPKTSCGLSEHEVTFSSIAFNSAHATNPKTKIIQESPVIDKNPDPHDSGSTDDSTDSISNSDVNGNSDEEIPAVVNESSVIETKGLVVDNNVTQTSPDVRLHSNVGIVR